MGELPSVHRRAELLLTSGGVTTDAMRQRLYAMGKSAGRLSKLRILRIADGWQPFKSSDNVSLGDRLEQTGEHIGGRLWSTKYTRWVLGKNAVINTESIGNKTPESVNVLLYQTDLLLLPGGNTYQLMRGLSAHREVIRNKISEGLPTVGESAGSIALGYTIKPASLAPADTCPDPKLLGAPGLDYVHGDVLVHIKREGKKRDFDITGPLARITERTLDGVASNPDDYSPQNPGTKVLQLTETRAYSVSDGFLIAV